MGIAGINNQIAICQPTTLCQRFSLSFGKIKAFIARFFQWIFPCLFKTHLSIQPSMQEIRQVREHESGQIPSKVIASSEKITKPLTRSKSTPAITFALKGKGIDNAAALSRFLSRQSFIFFSELISKRLENLITEDCFNQFIEDMEQLAHPFKEQSVVELLTSSPMFKQASDFPSSFITQERIVVHRDECGKIVRNNCYSLIHSKLEIISVNAGFVQNFILLKNNYEAFAIFVRGKYSQTEFFLYDPIMSSFAYFSGKAVLAQHLSIRFSANESDTLQLIPVCFK